MSKPGLPSSTVQSIAANLENDIRRRGLRPGDRYLTAAEASRMFSVSAVTVNRAMQMLADRDLLVRQRSRGTFVGPKFRAPRAESTAIEVVHLFMAMDYHITQAFSTDGLVDEFAAAVPGAILDVHHIPHLSQPVDVRYARGIIDRVKEGKREALVLIRCSRQLQLLVSDERVPAVVFGQAYPGVTLPCVRYDQGEIGQMMARDALDHGCHRFAVVTHAQWRHGDQQMLDGATHVLAAAGVGLSGLKIRSLLAEPEVIAGEVRRLLEEEQPPDAFLCRNEFYARTVYETAAAVGKGDQVYIVSGGHSPCPTAEPFAQVVSKFSLPILVEHLAGQLSAAVRDATPQSVLVPVEYLAAGTEFKEPRNDPKTTKGETDRR